MKCTNLEEQLISYTNTDAYPFHMPGHKRRKLGDWIPEEIDITEITDFDNLHHAEGILAEGQERLARVFGADHSFYLINGSTAGLLAAISGCTKRGDHILIARNCHKAVYHAIYLMELQVSYLSPEETAFGIQGQITARTVREMLTQYPDTRAVVLTSPTYDGVVSDIAAIAELVHEKQIPLIVDEAHGAHFGFSNGFPQKAHQLGADLCVESVHKTLPAYTQTAVLHMKKWNSEAYYFDAARVQRYLGIYQTSSPSYVLMAGIERCVRLVETQGAALFDGFETRLRAFYKACGSLQYIQVYDGEEAFACGKTDPSKILICAQKAGYHGQALFDILRDRYQLELEMCSGHYVTALTSIMDTQEGFDRLWMALKELDDEACRAEKTELQILTPTELYRFGKQELCISEAMDHRFETIALEESAGRISCEFIYLYPPGIPIVAPGERIEERLVKLLEECAQRGMDIEGMQDKTGRMINVII